MSIELTKEQLQGLLAKAASGDEFAWKQIVDAYAFRVFALLRSKCMNEDLAEEITQSTFCTVAEKLAGYTESGKFEPWLFRIAMNRLRDEMRRRKRHAVPMENEMIGILTKGTTDSESDNNQDELTLKRLREAVRMLPSSDQDIIHMRHSAGMSYKQIASALDEPLGTVLARQHRAIKKLRSLMETGLEQEKGAIESS